MTIKPPGGVVTGRTAHPAREAEATIVVRSALFSGVLAVQVNNTLTKTGEQCNAHIELTDAGRCALIVALGGVVS